VTSPKANPPKKPRHEKRRNKKIAKSRRPSFDIARDYVEMNFAVLMEPELTPKELKKKRKSEAKAEKKAEKQRHRVRNAFLSLLGLIFIAAGVAFLWWNTALQPVKPLADGEEIVTQKFTVYSGDTTDEIAANLQKFGFIRSELAFRIYCRLNGIIIQAGEHQLSPSHSTQEIAEILTEALAKEIEIQIPPGQTLDQLRGVLLKITDENENRIYSNADIDAAYTADYNSSLFDGRPKDLPAKTRLEGYIYPDTYRIYQDAPLEDLVKKSLKRFEEVAAENDLTTQFAARGLSFYEGLILASIIEKEVPSATDRKMVAGVFFNRLAVGEPLGADATYKYAFTRGLCAVDGPSCDSAYNTRKHGGFPPGPISNVNLTALVAVAEPTDHDYFYYVSGDDGTNHFSRTLAEHEANIAAYCHELCR